MKTYAVVLGTNSIDEYYEIDTVPVMGEKIICTHMEDRVGGMLGNAAAVLAGYGSKTYMIDVISAGAYGKMIQIEMRKSGIDASYCTIDPSITDSRCLILLKDGERLIAVIPNNKKDIVLSEEQTELILGAEYLYTTVSELGTLKNAEAFILQAKESGVKLALDIEPGTLMEKEFGWFVLSHSDILFINQGGKEKMRQLYGDYEDSFFCSGCILVYTKGKDGCQVRQQKETVAEICGMHVPVVDTTGAGDTFNASFLFGLMKKWSLQKCAEFANGAAARAIGALGPRTGVTDERDVWEFFRRYS